MFKQALRKKENSCTAVAADYFRRLWRKRKFYWV